MLTTPLTSGRIGKGLVGRVRRARHVHCARYVHTVRSPSWLKTDLGEHDVITMIGDKRGHQLKRPFCVAEQASWKPCEDIGDCWTCGIEPVRAWEIALGASSGGQTG